MDRYDRDMAKAEAAMEHVRDLIERTEALGWGVAFDHNRHGQWRISRVNNARNDEMVADSDLATACKLALEEVERLSPDDDLPSPGDFAWNGSSAPKPAGSPLTPPN
jgi:hypothetical protein